MLRMMPVLSLALLTGCLSPQEQCIADATRELRTLRGLASETRANLARGYALEEFQEVEVVRTTCRGENEDGTTFTFECEETETRDRTRRVAIDLNAEARTLDSLEQRIARLEQGAAANVAQCRALYPE